MDRSPRRGSPLGTDVEISEVINNEHHQSTVSGFDWFVAIQTQFPNRDRDLDGQFGIR
jgi:hypothetical protein